MDLPTINTIMGYDEITGVPFISRLASWKIWRQNTSLNGEPWGKLREMMRTSVLTSTGVVRALNTKDGNPYSMLCPICDGALRIQSEHGQHYCLCYVLRWQSEIVMQSQDYRSHYKPAFLEEMDLNWPNNPFEKQSLRNAVETVGGWMQYPGPDTWLVLSGPPGNGKTHLLRAIATELSPIAVYVTATDFTQTLFDATRDGMVGEMLKVYTTVPILLLDDFGAEHTTEYAASHITHVIDRRYAAADELITAVATNFGSQGMLNYNKRVGSRLLDVDISVFVQLTAGDYRRER